MRCTKLLRKPSSGRVGEGPTLLEVITYRYLGHSKSDANLYRIREEIQTWREQDPIRRFAAKIEEEGLLGEDEWRELDEEARQRIEGGLLEGLPGA